MHSTYSCHHAHTMPYLANHATPCDANGAGPFLQQPACHAMNITSLLLQPHPRPREMVEGKDERQHQQ
jgi:hypothetical protein